MSENLRRIAIIELDPNNRDRSAFHASRLNTTHLPWSDMSFMFPLSKDHTMGSTTLPFSTSIIEVELRIKQQDSNLVLILEVQNDGP